MNRTFVDHAVQKLGMSPRFVTTGPSEVSQHVLYCTQSNTLARNMSSTTFTVRIDPAIKKRLERLAKNTGRSRSFLAAEAIAEYLAINEWQVAGIKRAIASLDRGERIAQSEVEQWVASWGSDSERPPPKRSAP